MGFVRNARASCACRQEGRDWELYTGGKGGGGGQGEIKSDTKLENHDDDDHQGLDTKGMQKRQHCIPRTVSSMQKGHSMSSSSNSLLCMLLNDHAMSDR